MYSQKVEINIFNNNIKIRFFKEDMEKNGLLCLNEGRFAGRTISAQWIEEMTRPRTVESERSEVWTMVGCGGSSTGKRTSLQLSETAATRSMRIRNTTGNPSKIMSTKSESLRYLYAGVNCPCKKECEPRIRHSSLQISRVIFLNFFYLQGCLVL